MIASSFAPALPARSSAAQRRSGCRQRVVRVAAQESMSESYARIREQRKRAAAKFKKQQELEEKKGLAKLFGGVVSALDFQEDIAEDRGLLAKAKRLGKGESMGRDSYDALKRKVGGTKSGFFGESIEVKGKYAERGYVASDEAAGSTPPFVGILVATVLGVVLVTVLLILRN